MITGHVPAVRLPSHHAGDHVAAAIRREETWQTAEILILRATSSPYCNDGSCAART
jgi:hypothetical protein